MKDDQAIAEPARGNEPVASVLIDQDGVVRSWSEGARRLFGYGDAEAIGQDVATLIVPESLRDSHHAGVRRAAARGHSHRAGTPSTMPAVDASGAQFVIELTIVPIVHPTGTWSLGVARPIEDQSPASIPPVELLTTIFERAPEAITLLDAEGRQVTVNEAGASMTGYGPSGRHPSDGRALVHPEDRDRLAEHFAERIAGRGDWTMPTRYRVLGGDGRWIWLETLLADLTDVPSVGGYVAFSRDVTADEARRAELVEARRAAEETGDRLRRLASARLAFAAAVSHELRTPLTSISSAAETLLTDEQSDDDQLVQYLELIDRNSRRLARLVEDLLLYSRLDAGLLRLYPERVDVAALVRSVADELRERAALRSIDVVPTGAPSAWIVADTARLRQVLDNIVGNAIKFAEPGTPVTVAVRSERSTCAVTVENRGVPIDAEDAERIFEPFVRSDTVDRSTSGAGLGLPLSRLLVEGHGGTLVCDHRFEPGARFVVTLPLEPAAATHPESEPPS